MSRNSEERSRDILQNLRDEKVEITETYFYHDGPRLYLAQLSSKDQYLVSHVEESDEDNSETYLYAPISHMSLVALKQSVFPLSDFFTDTTLVSVYAVTTKYTSTGLQYSLEILSPNSVPSRWLPSPMSVLQFN